MARLINAEVMGFFATPPVVTDLISTWFTAPDAQWRLLDPCCGEGVAAAHLATAIGGTAQTWGVELAPQRAAAASERLDQVFNTAWSMTRVSKEAVSLLYLNPPYDHDLDGESKRLEIEFLRTALNTLVIGGVLVYVVPQHLLRQPAVARLLAGHFEHLAVRRFPDGEYERFKQVVVFARRKPYVTPRSETLDWITALHQADLPPLSTPPENWERTLPPAPLKARFYRTSVPLREQLALAHSTGWPEDLSRALSTRQQQPYRPVLPLKKGHIAMLMASGLMGNLRITHDGRPLLVKGRVLKGHSISHVENDSGETVEIKRDTFTTTVGVIGQDGVQVIDDVEALGDFMEDHAGALAAEILKHRPRYDLQPTATEWDALAPLGQNRPPLPGHTQAGLLPVQKHVTIGLARTLREQPSVLLQGEMGIGKTTVGLATIDTLNAYPALVICPPHLVEKWRREAEEVIPGVQTRELRRIGRVPQSENPPCEGWEVNDARQFLTDWEAGRLGDKAIAVMAETSAKLGSGWRGAAATRYTLPDPRKMSQEAPRAQATTRRHTFRERVEGYHAARQQVRELVDAGASASEITAARSRCAQKRQAALKAALAYPVCPDCGSPVETNRGAAATFKYLNRTPYTCMHQIKAPGWAQDKEGHPILDDHEQPVFTWDPDLLPRCDFPLYEFGDRFRRWPIAHYIRTHHPHAFQLLVADEVHEYRSKGSDRGQAFFDVVRATRYHLALTGTVYGGKATSVFHLFYRLFPNVREDFAFGDEKRWAEQYGVLEERRTVGSDGGDEYSRFTASKRGRVTVSEKPGVSPGILEHIIDTSVFISLEDLGIALSPYAEEALPLSMTPSQATQYRAMEAVLRARAREDPRWLSTWLQWSLSRPNSGFRPEMVTKTYRDDDGNVEQVVDFMPLPQIVNGVQADGTTPTGADPLPKAEWMVDFVKAEKTAKRKVLVFVRQSSTRDIQPRLQALLEAQGVRAEILRSSVDTRQREQWVADHVPHLDVLICNPGLVQTGLDLVQFATVIFYELSYDLFEVQQACRRVRRITQRQPVKVIFTSYSDTLEEDAVRLMGQKMKAAQLLYGDEVGGAIVPDDGENFMTELARNVLEGRELPDIKALFAVHKVSTESPLGSPTATSPRLPTPPAPSLTWQQAMEQARRQLAAALEKQGRLSRKEKRTLVQEALPVEQMTLFS